MKERLCWGCDTIRREEVSFAAARLESSHRVDGTHRVHRSEELEDVSQSELRWLPYEQWRELKVDLSARYTRNLSAFIRSLE